MRLAGILLLCLRITAAATVCSGRGPIAAAGAAAVFNGKELGVSAQHEIEAPGAEPIHCRHGTTTVALTFEGGVIAAVDSRASMGSFIGSRSVMKVIPVTDTILGTMAGGAADCSFWLRHLTKRMKALELERGSPGSLKSASLMLSMTLHGLKGLALSVGTMLMGWDAGTGGGIYYVDSEGSRMAGDYFAVGSGSTYAYGVLDTDYRFNMTIGEAADLGTRAVRYATHRDAYSGGHINVFHVNETGWHQLGEARSTA